ncbi:sushi, von Willebrand factor type A, EGF and pentraxin domain-containing protein 1-like [Penaeus monodon]|uniref:sushi, von Willebrand factor type A, EGF and pentraxin domain-containing protein 1-like n=1 Tax=Penaeus monodon TaxID=6687 RepID=UPI0018A7A44A|nr:sushi, von Willebrand factor type A, EGF and pentraxin domain-containing protein 1-like [Penaeus monodon]
MHENRLGQEGRLGQKGLVSAVLMLTLNLCGASMITSRDEILIGHCDPPKIPNGAVVPVQHTYQIGATVEVVCSGGFVLQEENRLHCTNDGTWATASGYAAILECEAITMHCEPPPNIEHGSVQVLERENLLLGSHQESLSEVDRFQQGSVAEYSCDLGYWLHPSSHSRHICLRGLWMGEVPRCVSKGCMSPEPVMNGYYLEVTGSSDVQYPPGARLQFVCHVGYTLRGGDLFDCNETGHWMPRTQPVCKPSPELIEEFTSCVAPPNIAHGYMSDSASSYALQSQVYYDCELGYRLVGPSVLTCEETGCWTPRMPPVCQLSHQFEDEIRNETTVLDMHTILVATTGSVIGILLIVLALILYQRAVSPKLVRLHNSGSGGELPPPPHNCPPNSSQTQQEHDPDRVALIPFPDEGVPPTYEEAVRHRPAVMFEPHGGNAGGRYTPHGHRSRGHRVVVPSVRRSRHRDNPDNISYQSIGSARQSSSTSRSMSMRSWSACDSLGSTDTVAVSDSTNVTVDTQSSGGTSSGASQAPSCRALAGSLASFDTSSQVNNEGAPLLEEAEGDEGCDHRAEDQYSLSTRDSDSLKDNVSHTRSVTISLQE